MTNEYTTCESIKEFIPLLATNALDAEEQAQVELHLNACPNCQEQFQAQRQALETIRKATEDEANIDSDKILATLKHRMAVESREHILPATAAISSRSSIVWLATLIVGVIAVLVLIAFLAQPPGRPSHPSPPKPVAIFFQNAGGLEDSGKDLYAKELVEADDRGGRIVFPNNAEVRLKPGSTVTIETDQALRLKTGQLAIWIPKQQQLKIRGPRGTATSQENEKGKEGARFTLEVGSDQPAAELLQVAHGTVRWKGSKGAAVSVNAEEASRLSAEGQAIQPWSINARQAFAWVTEQTFKLLRCEFKIEPRQANHASRPWKGVIAIRNIGDRAISISKYYPLGVNYQLELRRRHSKSSEFQKLSPTAIRRRIAPDQAETFQATKGQVTLEPGHSYELVIDLNQIIGTGAIEWCAAHYIGYEQTTNLQGSGSIHGVWGFTLRSGEVKIKGVVKK